MVAGLSKILIIMLEFNSYKIILINKKYQLIILI